VGGEETMTTNTKCKHIYGIDRYEGDNFGLTDDPTHVSPMAEFDYCPFCGIRLNEPEPGEEDEDAN